MTSEGYPSKMHVYLISRQDLSLCHYEQTKFLLCYSRHTGNGADRNQTNGNGAGRNQTNGNGEGRNQTNGNGEGRNQTNGNREGRNETNRNGAVSSRRAVELQAAMTRDDNSYLPGEQGPNAVAQVVIQGNQNNQLRPADAPQLGISSL